MINANDLMYPSPHQNDDGSMQFNVHLGLTKREYFAAMAMQCFVESEMVEGLTFREVADRCVLQADALIEALNK